MPCQRVAFCTNTIALEVSGHFLNSCCDRLAFHRFILAPIKRQGCGIEESSPEAVALFIERFGALIRWFYDLLGFKTSTGEHELVIFLHNGNRRIGKAL